MEHHLFLENLTLGQLIAFRILSGYYNAYIKVIKSLAKLSETALSLERLADIVDHPEEIEIQGKTCHQFLKLKVKFNIMI